MCITRDREMFAALNYKFDETMAAIKSRNYIRSDLLDGDLPLALIARDAS